MDTLRFKECILSLNELKKDTQENQKKGLSAKVQKQCLFLK